MITQARHKLISSNLLVWMLLLTGVWGCAPQTVKLPLESALNMKRLIIVAVEPPPLEVIPDLIETRQPAIRSLEAMSLPVYSSPALLGILGRF